MPFNTGDILIRESFWRKTACVVLLLLQASVSGNFKSQGQDSQALVLQLRGGSIITACFSGCCSGPPRAKKAGKEKPVLVDSTLQKAGGLNVGLF
eukprot:754120-Hanusia_phi.AAC.1